MKIKLLLASLLLTGIVSAQTAGTFDTTFGTNGKITSASPDILSVEDMALQSDGKIITVGYTNISNNNFAIARYLQNGTLDNSFGTTGIVTVDLYGYSDSAKALAIQPDGKILVAGYSSSQPNSSEEFGIIRLNSNGTLDSSFGSGGKLIIDFGSGAGRAQTIALQPDGKIIVAGSAVLPGNTAMNFAVARLNQDGSLDLDFSNDGKQTKIMITDESSNIQKVKVLSDGKILLGGYAGSFGNISAGLLKLLPDGSFDTSFNNNGSKTYPTALVSGEGTSMTFLPDNSILYGGRANNDAKIYKLNSNLDAINSFGNNGSVTVDIDNSSSEGNVKSLVFDSLGNFYATGTTSTSGSSYFYILNFTPDGALNTQFSFDGKLLINFANSSHTGCVAVLQPDAKLLVGGYYSPSFNIRTAIARVNVQTGFLGMNDLTSREENFSVYPNPAKDFVIIKNTDRKLINQNVQIFDATGRILLQKTIEDEKLELNISHLGAGTYYIRIGDKISKKLIKK